MPCMQQSSASVKQAYHYRFLTHGLTSVSYSQRGSDTNRCGTPAQSDRFTLHCQPRDQVFWQCSTYWYRNNRFINLNIRVQRFRDTNWYEAWRHISCGNTINIIYITSQGLDTIDEELYGSGIMG